MNFEDVYISMIDGQRIHETMFSGFVKLVYRLPTLAVLGHTTHLI